MSKDVAKSQSKTFIDRVTALELNVIEELALPRLLTERVRSPKRLSLFATAFYFVRAHFVKLNFIIGARCPAHELYWAGLAHNLMEELGGGIGPPHNELYRWFMQETGIKDENSLKCPRFAAEFDRAWEDYSRDAPLEEALGAIAVYEILDNPDYRMLCQAMASAGVSKRGLMFFKVHAKAAHFELFEDYFRHISKEPGGMKSLTKATDFVVQTQRNMWSGLLEYLAGNTHM